METKNSPKQALALPQGLSQHRSVELEQWEVPREGPQEWLPGEGVTGVVRVRDASRFTESSAIETDFQSPLG